MADLTSRLALGIYGALSYAAQPFSGLFLRARARRGKEIKERLPERYGFASKEVLPKSDNGSYVWVHAASIGETKAVLPLIKRLTDMRFQVIFTTVTVTAAKIASVELPKGAVHQFAPLDLKPFVSRFLKTWQPALAVFVESELWPNMMTELTKRHIPQVLVNARMSERSFARWRKIGSITHSLFDNVNLCIAQTEEDVARFSELGVQGVINGGNLKFDSDMPEIDVIAFSRLQSAIGGRRIWLAASTHDQEEMIVAKAHMHLKRTFPDLLTIVVPRHPDRADEIVSSLANLNLNVVQRSHNEMPKLTDDIYIADTIGELGLFYSLSPCSLVGGSLVPHGGQNPIEPARLGSAIVHGPNVDNFANIFIALAQEGGCVCVKNSEELVRHVADILANRDRNEQMTQAASQALQGLGGALERTHNALMPYLRPLILSGRLADADARYVAGE